MEASILNSLRFSLFVKKALGSSWNNFCSVSGSDRRDIEATEVSVTLTHGHSTDTVPVLLSHLAHGHSNTDYGGNRDENKV